MGRKKEKERERIITGGGTHERHRNKQTCNTHRQLSDLYVVKTEMVSGKTVTVRLGKVGQWCGDSRFMDDAQHPIIIDRDCLYYLQWGRDITQHVLSEFHGQMERKSRGEGERGRRKETLCAIYF